MMLVLLWAIWFFMNLLTFLLYAMDKRRAKRGAWRIPERTLLAPTWLLGGVGAWLAMRIFRHKTRHIAFQVSAPCSAVLSMALMVFASAKMLGMI